MDSRFGIKDFFLFLLLAGLIVLVCLAMKQYDRQWEQIQKIESKLNDQARDLRTIQTSIASGVAIAGPGQTPSTTQAIDPKDPFARIRAAKAMPGYAMGDWLVQAANGGVAKITPLLSGDLTADEIQGEVLEPLVTRDPETLDWKPYIAKTWQIYEKNLTITFQMRDDVKFSDGVPMTADDVVFTHQFIMNPKIAAPRAQAYYDRIASVTKKGPYEVVFKFKEPYFEMFGLAGGMQIMPKHFYEKFTPEDFNASVGYLLGSGPYRMENPTSWKPGALIQLVRNERYWGVQPGFNKLVWREITNDNARQIAFRNGEVDLFVAFPEQYRDMSKDPQITARSQAFNYDWPGAGYRYIAWNELSNGKPTRFADKRVRQAMTMLLNRQQMIQEVILGLGVQATGPFSPTSKQYDQSVKPWPFDVAQAKKQLADVGFSDRNGDGVLEGPDNKPFEFKLTYPSGNANYDKMVVFMKDSFARAGIVLKPDPLEWAVFTDRLKNKNFEAITLAWTSGIESDVYQMFHSSQMVEGGDNYMSYKSPELDKAIDEARRTIDESKRMELWHKVHQILHEDQPYTFLFFRKELRFLDRRIQNIQLTKLGMSALEEWFVPADKQKYTQ
jgi:peptide/nickel transport system substrate-binding protein